MAIATIITNDPTIIVAVITAFGSTIVTAIGGYYAHVLSKKPVITRKDVQETLNDTFEQLTEQLHKQNNTLLQRLEVLEKRIDTQDLYIRVLQMTLYTHEIPVPERPPA